MLKAHLIRIRATVVAIVLAGAACLPLRAEVIKGPYLQNVTTSGITIMWESSYPTVGVVLYGRTPDYGQTAREKEPVRIHEIRLANLDIQTAYHYGVLSGADRSADFTFQTAIRPDTPFSFVFYGDNKNGPHMHRRNAMAISAENPNLVLQCGDLVNRGEVYSQWERLFFTPVAPLINHVPLYPALGNHEGNADYYFKYLSLPGKKSYYSFDYGNAHFVVLDSASSKLDEGSEQWKWLVEDLDNSKATWKIVSFHHPPFTSGGNYYTKLRVALKNSLPGLFDKHGVDIAFNGHDHDYERTMPILSKGGTRPVTYIVNGNGGTPLRYVGKREWTAYSERVFGYSLVRINGRRLELEAKTVDGKIIDTLVIDKGDPAVDRKYIAGAITLESIKDPVEAIELANGARSLLASVAAQNQDKALFAKAIAMYSKAFELDPTFAEALVEMGRLNRTLGQEELAVEQFLKAIKILPVYPESYRELADIHLRRGAFDQAIEMAQRWAGVEPDQTGPEVAIANIYERQGNSELAILHLNKALEIVPSESRVHESLAELYTKIGRKAEARAHYREAIEWMDAEYTEAIQAIVAKIEALK
jgi:tetratricopeptide (TPR) repeat protein